MTFYGKLDNLTFRVEKREDRNGRWEVGEKWAGREREREGGGEVSQGRKIQLQQNERKFNCHFFTFFNSVRLTILLYYIILNL